MIKILRDAQAFFDADIVRRAVQQARIRRERGGLREPGRIPITGDLAPRLITRARAAIKTQTVEYKDGDTVLEGYLAYDDALKGKLPAVLIVHEWTGVGPYVKNRAQQLAGLGYVAFAIDIYGKGIRPADTNEAAKQATIYRADRQLMRRRALAGLEQVKKYPFVDPDKIEIGRAHV